MSVVARVPRGTVDAHVHFWDPAVLTYPWLDAVPTLQRAFLPEAYAVAATDAAVDRVLFVEGNASGDRSFDEVAFAERFVNASPPVAGIIAFADLASGTSGAAIDALASSPLVKGIRQNVQGQRAGFALQSTFIAGVRDVGHRGLTFDLCATHDQLDEMALLARACPNTRLVLDHCGKPAIRDRGFDAWARSIAAVATHDNVTCKISGLLTEAGAGWRDADLLPYVEHVVNVFGASRVMYGSDWPVLTLDGTYADWYGFVERFTASWSVDERQAFYRDTAVRTYRLR